MPSLDSFHTEVTDKGAEACLPRNLSDRWLEVLESGLEHIFDEAAWEPGPTASLYSPEQAKAMAVAAVLTLLRARDPKAPEMEIEPEILLEYLDRYRIEVALEMVHRRTDVKCDPATVETIFTDRNLRTWKAPR